MVTSASALGVLLAASVPLIIYAVIARVPINSMFLAGVVPAFAMVGFLVLLGGATSSAVAGRQHMLRWLKPICRHWCADYHQHFPGTLVYASAMFGKPICYVVLRVLPAVAAIFLGALVISWFSLLFTGLPNWLLGP